MPLAPHIFSLRAIARAALSTSVSNGVDFVRVAGQLISDPSQAIARSPDVQQTGFSDAWSCSLGVAGTTRSRAQRRQPSQSAALGDEFYTGREPGPWPPSSEARAVHLRVQVEALIRERRRQGEDIYAEQYNSLCSWALSVFPCDPSLEGKLSKMPDAVTQARPDMGIERLLARVSYLESALAMILQVDPRELPEAKGAADVYSLTQVKARRFQFLRRLYDSTRGRSQVALEEHKIGQEMRMAPDELDAITEYLEGEGLIELPTYGHVFNYACRRTRSGGRTR
jgi:hypothetical protein